MEEFYLDRVITLFETEVDVRRELVAGTLEVHRIKGYGAVEIGRHRFYHPKSKNPLGNHLKTGHTLSLQNRPKETIQNNSSYSAPSSLAQYFCSGSLGSLIY